MKKDRKILIISYHFHPDTAVGAIRPAKFAKYLSKFGWQPYVLTIKEKYISSKEYERLREADNAPVFRTTVWPTVLEWVVRLRKGLSRVVRKNAHKKKGQTILQNSGNQIIETANVFAGTTKRYLNSIFELPDKQIGWLIPAVWKAYRLIRREHIKFVLTSSPPRTTAVIGLFLSWMSDIKLITDLRDPWYLQSKKPKVNRSLLSDIVETWLEKKIMKRSERVITTTEHYRSFLGQHYSSLPKEKFHTIWNGYDEEDFADMGFVKPNNKFTISYLGTFYFGRNPEGFLKSLAELIRENMILESEVRVNFVGDVRYAEGKSVEDMVKSLNLNNCVTIQDSVSYKESLMTMKQSHVLLLFAPDQYYCIPAKAFEYVGAKKRILCFSKEGATSDFLRKTGAGIVVEPEDIQQIKASIQSVYSEYKGGQEIQYKIDTSIFERKLLSQSLSELIKECSLNND